jgi:hypothetical protein
MNHALVAILGICLCACAQAPISSNSEAVKEMADRAVKECGQGNVARVNVSGFECKS